MNIPYSTSKWMKEKKDAIKYDGINSTFHNIEKLNYTYENPNINSPIQVNDKITLLYLTGCEYKELANYEYLINNNAAKSYDYMAACLRCYSQAYSLFVNGNSTSNEAVRKSISSNEFLNEMALIALSLDKYPLVSQYMGDTIINSLYTGEFGEVIDKLKKLNTTADETREVYYNDVYYLRDIIMSLCEGDCNKLMRELILRIRKYRKNMVGYLTIIDITSIAILKIAKKFGYNLSLDVIEIPTRFLEDNS